RIMPLGWAVVIQPAITIVPGRVGIEDAVLLWRQGFDLLTHLCLLDLAYGFRDAYGALGYGFDEVGSFAGEGQDALGGLGADAGLFGKSRFCPVLLWLGCFRSFAMLQIT